MDVIIKNFMVPEDLNVEDWLVFGGMGAYTYGPKSEFNGMSSLSRVYAFKEESQSNSSVSVVGVESAVNDSIFNCLLGKNDGLVPKLSNSA